MKAKSYMFRVGLGQDSHKFSTQPKKLILGGVEIGNEKGLEANSDGDVLIHALCNALEQAIGNPSFSTYADEMCKKGITNSREYLKVAAKHIFDEDYAINNLGITIEAKNPKILPLTKDIKKSLMEILEVNEEDIGINATTGEEMTPFGKGEGIQCFAIVSIIKKKE